MVMNNLAQHIKDILMKCLYTNEELPGGLQAVPPDDAVIVQGLTAKFAFHPQRILDHKEEIVSILKLMSSQFFKSGGGGWSTLNLCKTEDGEQWGEHVNMEMLVVLGIGCKMVSYTLSKDLWHILPGGMPYVMFDM